MIVLISRTAFLNFVSMYNFMTKIKILETPSKSKRNVSFLSPLTVCFVLLGRYLGSKIDEYYFSSFINAS